MDKIFKDNELYTQEEVAKSFRVSQETVREWEKNGWVVGFKPPQARTVRYRGVKLNEFVEEWEGAKYNSVHARYHLDAETVVGGK